MDRCKNCGKVITMSNISFLGSIAHICSDCMNQNQGIDYMLMRNRIDKDEDEQKRKANDLKRTEFRRERSTEDIIEREANKIREAKAKLDREKMQLEYVAEQKERERIKEYKRQSMRGLLIYTKHIREDQDIITDPDNPKKWKVIDLI